MSKSSGPDPRVARTRAHVLATARTMLGERNATITFSTLSVRAEVSRRTLYTHWGTIENLFAETVLPKEKASLETAGLDLSQRLELFYRSFSDAVTSESAFGLPSASWASRHSESFSTEVVGIGSAVRAIFAERVAPITDDQYFLLVSPVLVAHMRGMALPDSLIASLVELGINQLGSVSPE